MMKKTTNAFISQAFSKTLSLTLALQLALPLSAFAGGNTYQDDVMKLGSRNISQGNVPTNTPEYLDSLCARIDEASKGTVGPDAQLKITQKYELETACKSSAQLPDAVKTYCTLYETAKTSQVKAYCDARSVAMKAKKGTDLAYKMDIAAAGTCWAEYLMIKAASSSGIAGGVSKFTQGKVCGTAAMAAGVVELGTTVSMAFKNKGKNVTADGQVKNRDDLTLYGGMLLSMGVGVAGISYGKCLLTGKGCDKGAQKSEIANKATEQLKGGLQEGLSGGGGGPAPAGTAPVVGGGGGGGAVGSGAKAVVGGGGNTLNAMKNLGGAVNGTASGGVRAPAATNPQPQPPAPSYDGTGKTKMYKWNPPDTSAPGGAYKPKKDPVIDTSEIITTFARLSPEFRNSFVATLQGDYYDHWKRGSFRESYSEIALNAPTVLLAACGPNDKIDLTTFKPCPPHPSLLNTNYKPAPLKPITVESVSKDMKNTHQLNLKTGQYEKLTPEQLKWKKMNDTWNDENKINHQTGKYEKRSEAEKNVRDMREGKVKNTKTEAANTKPDAIKDSTKQAKKEGNGGHEDKERLILQAAVAFTALAGMRYLTRNNAKKTIENAENLLNSMISSQPTLGNAVPTTKVGGGYKSGNGYVGGTSPIGNGDKSGLTGSPEDILAPRGSPQRGAFEKVAAQIPDSLLDSGSGPSGIGAAIGQVASAMGGDGQNVAAYSTDAADRAIAALGASEDIYATTGGGDGGSNNKPSEGLNLNLGGMNGEAHDQNQQSEEMNFRAPAASCNGDIYHAQCKTDKNMFQIVSERYSAQPISK